jgi:hypothetical protein
MALFAPLAWLTGLAHVFALASLLIVVGCFELSRGWAARRAEGAWRVLAGRFAILAAAALPAMWLAVQAVPASGGGAWIWGHDQRVGSIFLPVGGYFQRLDFALGVLFCGLLGLLVVTRRLAAAPGTLLSLAIFALFFAVAPMHTAMGGGYVPPRFSVFGALLACAGLRPDLSGLARRGAQLLVAALVIARTASIAYAWAAHGPQLAELRDALSRVPPGASVATVTVERTPATRAYFNDQPRRALMSFVYERSDVHLGAFAVIDRRAVWPFLFAFANQQPLRQVGPFAEGGAQFIEKLPPRDILNADRGPATWPPWAAPAWREAVEASWRRWAEFFDHVIVLNARAADDHAGFLPDRLELVHDGGFAVLYRVRPPPPPG